MRKKDTTKVYAVKDKGIYRLRAFTDKHQKCGEISLGLTDKRLAKCLKLLVTPPGPQKNTKFQRKRKFHSRRRTGVINFLSRSISELQISIWNVVVPKQGLDTAI